MPRIDIVYKENCTGCAACKAICPKQCIIMKADDEGGFIYPYIDENKCVSCGLCGRTCQSLNYEITKETKDSYVGWSSKEDIFQCASGGASSVINREFINNGVVYGAVFTSDLKVEHRRAETLQETDLFRKSKYIQSNIELCYQQVAVDLQNDVPVLFTGTSCQVAAIYKYMWARRINTEKLFTIDLLCHGVPSQHLFDVYRKEQEEKYGCKMVSFTFKNKKPVNGKVNSRSAEIRFENGNISYVGIDDDAFLKMYYYRLAYRDACMNCKFACVKRSSDITLADAWNIEKIKPNLDPLFGVSLILVNTDKGSALLRKIVPKFHLEALSSEWVFNSQKQFHFPSKAHRRRKNFLQSYSRNGFEKMVYKMTRISLENKIKAWVKSILTLNP